MTHASSNQPFITRWWVRLLVVVLGLVLLLVVATSVKVVETAGKQEVQPADAIVVFGAASTPAALLRSGVPGLIMHSLFTSVVSPR